MLRFLVGFGLAAVLTVVAMALGGVGHGSYVPLIFLNPLILVPLSMPAVSILLGPIIWGLYFMLLPRIVAVRKRTFTIVTICCLHVALGVWAAKQDPAFQRIASDSLVGLLIFGVLLVSLVLVLLYFSLRETR